MKRLTSEISKREKNKNEEKIKIHYLIERFGFAGLVVENSMRIATKVPDSRYVWKDDRDGVELAIQFEKT